MRRYTRCAPHFPSGLAYQLFKELWETENIADLSLYAEYFAAVNKSLSTLAQQFDVFLFDQYPLALERFACRLGQVYPGVDFGNYSQVVYSLGNLNGAPLEQDMVTLPIEWIKRLSRALLPYNLLYEGAVRISLQQSAKFNQTRQC